MTTIVLILLFLLLAVEVLHLIHSLFLTKQSVMIFTRNEKIFLRELSLLQKENQELKDLIDTKLGKISNHGFAITQSGIKMLPKAWDDLWKE